MKKMISLLTALISYTALSDFAQEGEPVLVETLL